MSEEFTDKLPEPERKGTTPMLERILEELLALREVADATREEARAAREEARASREIAEGAREDVASLRRELEEHRAETRDRYDRFEQLLRIVDKDFARYIEQMTRRYNDAEDRLAAIELRLRQS